MIKQYINLDDKWLIIVYYNIDYNQFNFIREDLESVGSPVEEIMDIHLNMRTYDALAFTRSSIKYKTTIIGFNKHRNMFDYLDSITHEIKHAVDDIMIGYNIENYGEPPAYTTGYIAKEMLKCFFTYLY